MQTLYSLIVKLLGELRKVSEAVIKTEKVCKGFTLVDSC